MTKAVTHKILALFTLLSVCDLAFAQLSVNEIKQKAFAEKNDNAKAGLFIQLAEMYRISSYDSSFKYASNAISILNATGNTDKISEAEINHCYYYNNTGNPAEGLSIADKNIGLLRQQATNQSLLAKYYSASGLCLMKMDKKKEALNRFFLALQNAEKSNDNSTKAKVYTNIGWAYMELNQFEDAIKNFQAALQLIKEKKLPENYSGIIYNNLASCYGSLNKIDSASINAKIAITKSQKSGDISAEANGLFILGSTQVKKGELNEALDNYLKAQPLREKIGDPFYIVSDQAEISSLYAKLGRTKEGIVTGEKALKVAEKNNISAKLPMIYSALASNYESANDNVKAIELYKKLNVLKDSMYADANPQALAEMQTKYETEKQERLIAQQKDKLRFQNFLFVGIGGLILLLGLLAQSQYKKFKLRQEAAFKTQLLVQQQQAMKAVMEAEENERERIAKDLHDGVGQMMSAAKMNLSAFESDSKFISEEQKKEFERIIQLVDESCREVRTVSHIMMPNALLKNNLSSAVKDFVNKLSSKTLSVHVYTEGLDKRVDSNIETVLYRVIQECVNNAIKHAGATKLDISLIRDKDGISGTIEDNGKGFDVTDKEKFEGIGLKNIITRIEYLKGTVDFDSAPGRGTLIALHVPA